MHEVMYINLPFLRITSWQLLLECEAALSVRFHREKIVLHYGTTEMWIEFGKQKKWVSVTDCVGADPTCPCQDGDYCHYKDYSDSPTESGKKAMPF